MQLVISKTAQIQISDFIEYYNNRNQTNVYSVKLVDALVKAFEQISTYPNLGRLTTKSELRVVTTFEKFLVYYLYQEERITIVSIVHTDQNIRL